MGKSTGKTTIKKVDGGISKVVVKGKTAPSQKTNKVKPKKRKPKSPSDAIVKTRKTEIKRSGVKIVKSSSGAKSIKLTKPMSELGPEELKLQLESAGEGKIASWVLDENLPEREIPIKDPETGEVTGFKILKPLTLREEVFVREYMKDFDHRATAKRMGVEGIVVKSLLQRQSVKAAVMSRAEKQLKSMDMDATWVLSNIRDVVERCMGDDKFDASNALRGLELVGKRLSMFTDKVEVNNKTVIRIESNVGNVLSGIIDVTPTPQLLPEESGE